MISSPGKVLVTGSSGFIGKHLVYALLREGWTVLALTHTTPLLIEPPFGKLQIIQADLNDESVISTVVSQVDVVCHFAAYIPNNFDDLSVAATCIQTNALATLNLAISAIKYHISRFIYASGGNSYIYSENPVSEENPIYPAKRATYYLSSKLLGEIYIEHLRDTALLNSICLRISTPYGYRMPTRSLIAQFMRLAKEASPLEVWDGGVTTYDYVYISDVVWLILKALQTGSSGIYNVGSGQKCSVLELAQTVADVFPEHNLPIIVKPPTGGIPASFSALSIEKAKQTWGYSPIRLKDGLLRYRHEMES